MSANKLTNSHSRRTSVAPTMLPDERFEAHDALLFKLERSRILSSKLYCLRYVSPGDLVEVDVMSETAMRAKLSSGNTTLALGLVSWTATFPNSAAHTIQAALEYLQRALDDDSFWTRLRQTNDEANFYPSNCDSGRPTDCSVEPADSNTPAPTTLHHSSSFPPDANSSSPSSPQCSATDTFRSADRDFSGSSATSLLPCLRASLRFTCMSIGPTTPQQFMTSVTMDVVWYTMATMTARPCISMIKHGSTLLQLISP